MRADDRPALLFAVLTALAAITIAAGSVLGLFGTIAWRGIDAMRLLAPILFAVTMLVMFARAGRGLVPPRVVMVICAVSLWPMSGILSNSGNRVVQVSACAVMVLAVALLATIAILGRKAKAKAA